MTACKLILMLDFGRPNGVFFPIFNTHFYKLIRKCTWNTKIKFFLRYTLNNHPSNFNALYRFIVIALRTFLLWTMNTEHRHIEMSENWKNPIKFNLSNFIECMNERITTSGNIETMNNKKKTKIDRDIKQFWWCTISLC